VAGLLFLFAERVAAGDRGRDLVDAIRVGDRPEAPSFDLPVIWDVAASWPADLRPSLADGRLSLGELRGYPVVLNFWASWCDPCKEEAPELVAFAREYAGRVLVLGLDVQDFRTDARRFLRRHGVNYPSVRDGGDDTYTAYGLTGLPETFFVDAEGNMVGHSLGRITRAELARGVAAIAPHEARE
jgi:cytochrome c biogenesis protein CcmG/thiol:disulfide interchange protein DsbE